MAQSEDRETVAERAVSFYHEAREQLNEFLSDKEIRDVLLELEDLVSEHNTRLDAAMRAIKSELGRLDQDKLVINGLGAQKKYKRYYDAEFLANALPSDQSDEILTERIVYDLDKERLEQLLRQGEIDNEIVEKAYHEEVQNPANLPGTPKPYVLPGIPVIE
jgi:hypothetical protein